MTKLITPSYAYKDQDITKVECNYCNLYNLCQLADTGKGKTAFNAAVKRQQQIAKAEYLFKSGEPFDGVFSVKTGIFKSIYHFDDNREQIIDFHLPGELIGFDAIENDHYTQSVIAVNNSSFCKMDFAKIKNSPVDYVAFQNTIIQTLSKKARLDQYKSLIIGAQSVEQQLSIFLTSIYKRLEEHDMPTECFAIPLRKDIANYLGVAIETVVRILKKFEKNGLIKHHGKRVTLSDFDEIKKLSRL